MVLFSWFLPEMEHFQVMKAEREARANTMSENNARAMELRVLLRDADPFVTIGRCSCT